MNRNMINMKWKWNEIWRMELNIRGGPSNLQSWWFLMCFALISYLQLLWFLDNICRFWFDFWHYSSWIFLFSLSHFFTKNIINIIFQNYVMGEIENMSNFVLQKYLLVHITRHLAVHPCHHYPLYPICFIFYF